MQTRIAFTQSDPGGEEERVTTTVMIFAASGLGLGFSAGFAAGWRLRKVVTRWCRVCGESMGFHCYACRHSMGRVTARATGRADVVMPV